MMVGGERKQSNTNNTNVGGGDGGGGSDGGGAQYGGGGGGPGGDNSRDDHEAKAVDTKQNERKRKLVDDDVPRVSPAAVKELLAPLQTLNMDEVREVGLDPNAIQVFDAADVLLLIQEVAREEAEAAAKAKETDADDGANTSK